MIFYYLKFIKKLKSDDLIKDSAWSLIGSIGSKGLSLLVGVIIARWLGKEGFGEFSIIKTFYLTVSAFATIGLGYSSTTIIASKLNQQNLDVPKTIKWLQGITFTISLIFAVSLILYFQFFSKDFLKIETTRDTVFLIGLAIILESMSTLQIGVLSGLKKFKILAKINFLIGAATFITGVLFTFFWGLKGAILSSIISSFFNILLIQIAINRNEPVAFTDLKMSYGIKLKILKLTFPIALQEIEYYVSTFFISYIIVSNSDFGELGIFNVSLQWNGFILFIPGILRNVLLTHLSLNLNNIIEFQKIVKRTIVINLISILIPVVVIFVFAKQILTIYGTSFDGVVECVRIAVAITIVLSVTNVFSQVFISLGKNWTMLLLKVIRDYGPILLFYLFCNGIKKEVARIMLDNMFVCNAIALLAMILLYRYFIREMNIRLL